MSGSDISDEDAILPAIGVLDDLDSDISFSDEDDPALQDHNYKNSIKPSDALFQSPSKKQSAKDLQQYHVNSSDYAVKDDFWSHHHAAARKNRSEVVGLSGEEKQAASQKAKARDAAITVGQFISVPRFTIDRPGFQFRDEGEHGSGYYKMKNQQVGKQASLWPEKCGGSLRMGLYKFTV